MRGVTNDKPLMFTLYEISTHTPHAGRDNDNLLDVVAFRISTHTPHAGRDFCV